MIFKLFRRSSNEALIARLHGEIMTQARAPTLFMDFGVADTPEGRFEMVAIHVLLAVRRLNLLPPPGPDLAQDLTDAMFRHFDIAFREMGISDTAVPKRMKKYASEWLGRARIYGPALDANDAEGLALALARNVYGSVEQASGPWHRLARYILAAQSRLAVAGLDDFLKGPIPALPPETVA